MNNKVEKQLDKGSECIEKRYSDNKRESKASVVFMWNE